MRERTSLFWNKCSICGQRLRYLAFPDNATEHINFASYSDTEEVNECRNCKACWHVRCAAARKDIQSSHAPKPSLKSLLKGALDDPAGGRQRLGDFLAKETKGLECPRCGKFDFAVGFQIS